MHRHRDVIRHNKRELLRLKHLGDQKNTTYSPAPFMPWTCKADSVFLPIGILMFSCSRMSFDLCVCLGLSTQQGSI